MIEKESDLKHSRAPRSPYPALFTRMSMRPCMDVAFSMVFSSSASGEQTSRASHVPPSFSTWVTSSGFLEGLREVAMTLWPDFRARRVSAEPNPEEHPVMSQTGDVEDMVLIWND